MSDEDRLQDPLNDPQFFSTMVRATSLLKFNKNEATDTENYIKQYNYRKHVLLYDAIATIMVTASSSQVIAASIHLTPSAVKVLWAHNDLSKPNPSDEGYYNRLIVALHQGANKSQLLSIVVEGCKPKIVSRIKKFVYSVERGEEKDEPKTSTFFKVDMENRNHQEIHESLINRDMCYPDDTLVEAFDNFVWELKDISKSSSTANIKDMVILSKSLIDTEPSIGPSKARATFLNKDPSDCLNPQQYSRLSKIADYYHACELFVAEIQRVKQEQRANLQLEQVFPPQLHDVEVPRTLVDCLNTWNDKFPDESEPIKSFADIKETYLEAQTGAAAPHHPPHVKVSPKQHAECTLALHLVQLKKAGGFRGEIEIGISKAACDWCHTWLSKYGEQDDAAIPIVYRATHGKAYENWAMPEKTPPSIQAEMYKMISDDMRLALYRAEHYRQRSDSPTIGPAQSVFGIVKEPNEPYTGRIPRRRR